MKKILLDVDDVVCSSGWLELINEYLNTDYKIDDFSNYYLDHEIFNEDELSKFYEFVRDKNQYENVCFLPGAVDAITKLSKYYDIYPCSDCRNFYDLEYSGRIFANKFDMLYKTFPQDVIPSKNYIFTGSKELVNGDIQIDDLVKNLSNKNIERRILFPSYHNKNEDEEMLKKNGIIKAGNDVNNAWNIIVEMLIDEDM